MKEIVNKRTLTSKSFDLGGGKKQYDFFLKHVHFEDNGKMEEIDTTLVDVGNGFRTQKTKYGLSIDKQLALKSPFEWGLEGLVFGLFPRGLRWGDKTVVFQDTADVPATIEGNDVVYINGLGQGHDLILRPDRTGLKKIVRINEPLDIKEGNEYLEVGFEIVVPEGAEIWYQDSANEPAVQLIRNELFVLDQERLRLEKVEKKYAEARAIHQQQLAKESQLHDAMLSLWDKSTDKRFLGEFQIRLGEKMYGRPVCVWDSVGKTKKVDVELRNRNGKLYLTKLIPVSFLQSAHYPIYTDTVTDYVAGSGDGNIEATDATWATVRGATTGSASSAGNPITVEASTGYIINRVFIPVDTSGIADTDNVDSCVLDAYWQATGSDGDTTSVHLVQTSQASTSTLADADYDNLTFTSGGSETLSGLAESARDTITFNATGLTWISKTGFTKIGLVNSRDFNNSAPTGSNIQQLRSTEGSDDEKLTITTTAAVTVTGGGLLLMGMA